MNQPAAQRSAWTLRPESRILVASNRPRLASTFVEHLRREIPSVPVLLMTAPSATELEAAFTQELADTSTPVAALVVLGGDGMVHIGANVLAGTEVPAPVPLGIVPVGSGNDFVRSLGTRQSRRQRRDMAAAAAKLANSLRTGSLREVDAMQVSGAWGSRIVMGIVSVGVDAIVNQRANALRFPPGQAKYVVGLAREFRSLKPRTYRIEATDAAGSVTQWSTTAWLASVANGQYLGGGMRIIPDALLDDGLLDLGVIRPLSFREFATLFPRIFSGRHASHDAMTTQRVTLVTLETPNMTAFGDGEALGPAPVSVTVIPRAISLLV